MSELLDALAQAWGLLTGADGSVRAIALRTILISGSATLLAVFAGVPIGYGIARGAFPGRTVVLGFINTAMGMPPVVVGLVVWLLLVRSGPFGGQANPYVVRRENAVWVDGQLTGNGLAPIHGSARLLNLAA